MYNGGGHTNRYTLKDIAYDKNGNITQLTRNGAINTNASSFGEMDRLSYAYYNGGNFLVKVSDAANKVYGFKDGGNTDNDYGRDANGNTTRDRNKGITSIPRSTKCYKLCECLRLRSLLHVNERQYMKPL